jgi:predicted 2-oxoglutarate/Fe(II)-dependent dioxygenase YbiX
MATSCPCAHLMPLITLEPMDEIKRNFVWLSCYLMRRIMKPLILYFHYGNTNCEYGRHYDFKIPKILPLKNEKIATRKLQQFVFVVAY